MASALPGAAHAQFLRLGPFDFGAKTGFDAIYTTNVEGERPSEATADREDYYLVWRLDLYAESELTYRTRLSIDTGLAIEKHFNRSDLDNSGAPFGRFNIRADSDWDPIRLYGGYRYERTSESVDDKFVPGGTKRRQVGTTEDMIVGADWIGEILEFGASFNRVIDRYDDDVFDPEEKDEDTLLYYVKLNLARNISIGYEYEDISTEFVNDPDKSNDELTETITLDFDQLLLERPELSYSLGIEREYKDGKTDGWELIHTFKISDEAQINSTLSYRLFASYEIEDNPEEDDIALQYGIQLEHELSEWAVHSFTATRQPVETLGSTEDTDETKYLYSLSMKDFFFAGMEFRGSAGYTISDPVTGETEKKWEYLAGVSHTKQISQRWKRKFSYEYSREDTNLEEEILDEHRVTLSYDFTF